MRDRSCIVYITEKVSHHAQNATFGLFAAARLFKETCRLHIRWIDIRGFKRYNIEIARMLNKNVYFTFSWFHLGRISIDYISAGVRVLVLSNLQS